jgi:hypothetical protein
MKIFNGIQCRGFNICYGYASGGEIVNHPNQKAYYTQNQFYVVDGSGVVSNGSVTIDLLHKQWLDLSQFKLDTKLEYTPGDNGCSWIIILPHDKTKEYVVENITDGIVAAQANSFLLVTEGHNVTFNNKRVKHLNYAFLTNDVEVATNGGVVAKFTEK